MEQIANMIFYVFQNGRMFFRFLFRRFPQIANDPEIQMEITGLRFLVNVFKFRRRVLLEGLTWPNSLGAAMMFVMYFGLKLFDCVDL